MNDAWTGRMSTLCRSRHQTCCKRVNSESPHSLRMAAPALFTFSLSWHSSRLFPVEPSNAPQHQQHGHTQERQLPLGERYAIIPYIYIIMFRCEGCCEMITGILGENHLELISNGSYFTFYGLQTFHIKYFLACFSFIWIYIYILITRNTYLTLLLLDFSIIWDLWSSET